jgi:hypothetical protein
MDNIPWSCETFNFDRADRSLACGVLMVRTMHGAYTLGKPIVAVPVGATRTTTLPSGASVELRHNSQTSLVQVIWQHRSFMVHLPDLLDACRVEDVGEITCRVGLGSASDEAE